MMRRAVASIATGLATITLLGCAAADAAAAKRMRTSAPRKAAHQPELIVCATNNGCHEVPRGCGYEYRRSGHGSVVVILCDRR
jgi:hypothetical protein